MTELDDDFKSFVDSLNAAPAAPEESQVPKSKSSTRAPDIH